MILLSAEIRWFFMGAMPGRALEWFDPDELRRQKRQEEKKTHSYLILTGAAATSVKLREGNFEIKALRSGPTVVEHVPGILGREDTWLKWTVKFEMAKSLRAMTDGSPWIGVEKTRWLLKYAIEPGQDPKDVDNKEYPDEGCNVEITDLAIGESRWWSIGFEAFGPPTRIQLHLKASLEAFFTTRTTELAHPFTAANSMSYPAWFASVGLA